MEKVVTAMSSCRLTINDDNPNDLSLGAGTNARLVGSTLILRKQRVCNRASGNSVFGLLTSRSARLLKIVSYCMYLTHDFVLYLASRLVNHFTDISGLSVSVYRLFIAIISIVTVFLSLLTYRFIEHPYISLKQVVPQVKNI